MKPHNKVARPPLRDSSAIGIPAALAAADWSGTVTTSQRHHIALVHLSGGVPHLKKSVDKANKTCFRICHRLRFTYFSLQAEGFGYNYSTCCHVLTFFLIFAHNRRPPIPWCLWRSCPAVNEIPTHVPTPNPQPPLPLQKHISLYVCVYT